MGNPKEGLYSSAVGQFKSDYNSHLFNVEERLPQRGKDYHFAMRCNGYFLLKDGKWKFNPDSTQPFSKEFTGQQVSFFGPNSFDSFFSGDKIGNTERFVSAFNQETIIDTIGKYRAIDEDLAARIAFLLGGLVRYVPHHGYQADKIDDRAKNAVKFASRMAKLGEGRNGDAIVSAMAMYVISGGSLNDDKNFEGSVFRMGEAVRKDPVTPKSTDDLGLSQVMRLRSFLSENQSDETSLFYRQAVDIMDLEDFPTVGAEFHFSPDAPQKFPNLWQRLAILNMSQYQRGSYIQLSRNDRNVIEVRMNPSTYPIAVANWNHLRLLLPELNKAFFTVTFNRSDEDFFWKSGNDGEILKRLRAIGMLSYAAMFNSIPRRESPEEIDFGNVYLGQTVKLDKGQYKFTGNWSGGEGQYGQMGIYAGFGDNFPLLAYYLSMVLARPEITQFFTTEFISQMSTLGGALAISPQDRRVIFTSIQNRIESDDRLNNALQAGNRIINGLNP